jgi:CRISPR-associated protein Cmr4
MTQSYQKFTVFGMAIDPIHVGTGGARLGRVDLSIVRDPVTRVPKVPGSSLAGVCRAYAAMALNKYPNCAGQGQPNQTGTGGHCGQAACPICTIFGFARGAGGGFAGLAAFSDAHLLLFPVATREGPVWVTCPDALRRIGHTVNGDLGNAAYMQNCEARRVENATNGNLGNPADMQRGNAPQLNLGWLLLERKNQLPNGNDWPTLDKNICDYISMRVVIVSDKLFTHIVNSNLEVRTSVSINPETGAAEEGALFSYEALPRATVLVWDVVCKNPQHFQVGGQKVSAQINGQTIDAPAKVFDVVKTAHPYLEHLGIGGMGTRGMGRLRVIDPDARSASTGQTLAEQGSSGGE